MKVQIEGNLYLESDPMQFIIKEYTGNVSKDKNTGKETELYNTHGYFTSIDSAIRYLVKLKLKESKASDLRELLEDFNRLDKWIHSLFQSA